MTLYNKFYKSENDIDRIIPSLDLEKNILQAKRGKPSVCAVRGALDSKYAELKKRIKKHYNQLLFAKLLL